MRIVLGLFFVCFGLFGWVGQLISGFNYSLAQRLSLQEKSEGTDPLFRLAELNAARWDACVLWTLPLAGVLMLLNHPWWPYVALVAGGIHLDAGGRELAKSLSLRKGGVKIGSPKDWTIAKAFLSLLVLIGLVTIAYALWALGTGAPTART
ncbi:MAG: hypothetical protein ACOYXY_06110 [Thermodesulfobacteriota bacterium]